MAGPAFTKIGTGRGATLPSNIQVRFQGRRCFGLVSDVIPRWFNETISVSRLMLPISIPNMTLANGKGMLVLKDTAMALYGNAGGPPTNEPALKDLATQMAVDYISWNILEFDITFNGVLGMASGFAAYDLIEYKLDIDDITTRLMTSPWRWWAEEFQHNDPANAGCKDASGATPPLVVSQAPCVSVYGPLAMCVSGSLHIPRYNICLEDGRLFQTYIKTDIINATGS